MQQIKSGLGTKGCVKICTALSITDLKLYFFLRETMEHEKEKREGRDNRHSRHIKTLQEAQQGEQQHRQERAEELGSKCTGYIQAKRTQYGFKKL